MVLPLKINHTSEHCKLPLRMKLHLKTTFPFNNQFHTEVRISSPSLVFLLVHKKKDPIPSVFFQTADFQNASWKISLQFHLLTH